MQSLEPVAGQVEALRGEVAAQEEALTDCLTSLGQEEAKVGGLWGPGMVLVYQNLPLLLD